MSDDNTVSPEAVLKDVVTGALLKHVPAAQAARQATAVVREFEERMAVLADADTDETETE